MVQERRRETRNLQQQAHSSLLTLNARVELHSEKGPLATQEILDRVKRLQGAQKAVIGATHPL
jgi:hypothetical protein